MTLYYLFLSIYAHARSMYIFAYDLYTYVCADTYMVSPAKLIWILIIFNLL